MGILDVPFNPRLYATTAVPSAQAPRTGRFSPDRSLYVPPGANLRKIKAKLGAVQAGTTTRAKIACVGHSEVAGYGGTVGTNDWPTLLRNLFATRFGCPVGGYVMAYNATPGAGADPRWVFDAAYTYAGSAPGANTPNLQLHRRAQANAKVATFTSDKVGTAVDIFTFGNTVAFDYSIDGGGAVTMTPSTASAPQIITVTGLANTTHTVAITTKSSGSTFIAGVNVRSASGVEVSNMGYYGSYAVDWISAQWFNAYNDVVSGVVPDLAIVQLDANEVLHDGVSAGSPTNTATVLRTNLNSLVAGLKATMDVLLVVSPSMVPGGSGFAAVSQALWDSYINSVYDAADTQVVPLLDITNRWGVQATAAANGQMFDQVHPKGEGYGDIANAIYRVLTD